MIGKKKSDDNKKFFRSKYLDHSRNFQEWVNGLGIGKSVIVQKLWVLSERFAVRRWLMLFTFAFILSYVLFYELDFGYNARIGEIAMSDIKSPLSFTVIDELTTEKKRREAEMTIPPVFDFYPDVYDGVYSRINHAFKQMREYLRQTTWPQKEQFRDQAIREFFQYKPEFEKLLGNEVDPRLFEWLIDRRFSVHYENVVIELLASWSRSKIAENPSAFLQPEDNRVIIRFVERSGPGDEVQFSRNLIRDLRHRSNFGYTQVPIVKSLSENSQGNAYRFALSLLVPNLTFNRQETELRRRKASETVLPIKISVQKNQTIVSAGSVVQPNHLAILNEINAFRTDRNVATMALISALLITLLVSIFFNYFRYMRNFKTRVSSKDIGAMALVALMVVCLQKLYFFVTDAAFVTRFGEMIPPIALLYAAPFVAGSMVVGLLVSSAELVWIYTILMSAIVAFMADMDFSYFLVNLASGVVAARSIFDCERRNDIYMAGIKTGLANATAIFFTLSLVRFSDGTLSSDLIWAVPAGFVSGVLSAVLAMILIPIFETVFNYTTNVKLLELSNLNHPVMHDMMVKAPGTYHHCIAVGTMVEAGASVIGANALMGRVMAYYHDIGKMDHAQYFIENQRPGSNPHDHITPFMSKTVLVAHVKDGAEMAIKNNLGKPIVDGILQHHGTTLISYFYNKAREAADENIEHVEESDFRYPGPKPQFREAALVMLADSIEAAARSIEDPTAARLTNLVKNIIQSKFLDGQLDECDLTLRDLSQIEEAYTRTLLSLYHQRIDYPNTNIGVTANYEKIHGRKGFGSTAPASGSKNNKH